MITISGKGDGWKGVILGMLTMVFIAEILFLATRGIGPVPTIDSLGGKPGAAATPSAQAPLWREVARTVLTDGTINVQGWEGKRYADDGALAKWANVRSEIAGSFDSSVDARLAILDDASMDALKARRAPAALYAFTRGHVTFRDPEKPFWLVFYVPQKGPAVTSLPISEFEIGMLLVRSALDLLASYPVTAHLESVIIFHGTQQEADALRAAIAKQRQYQTPSVTLPPVQ